MNHQATAYTYTFIFSKTGGMVYISHLDLLRLMSRAARRAGLPVSVTQGFNPHFKIRLKRALKLGVSSDREEGQIVLDEEIDETELMKRLQSELPQGLLIKELRLRKGEDSEKERDINQL